MDYTGNCGNCSSAVGPFAIEEGLVPAREGETVVRIHNTNTKKLIVSRVPVAGGAPAVRGDFELPGVAGRGARIALDFVEPGGAGTGRLLPTGHPRDTVEGVTASLVDASIPMIFVRAADLGMTGTETPSDVDADAALCARLEAIRVAAARLMGIPGSAATPKVAVVTAPTAFTALDGVRHEARPPTWWAAPCPWAIAIAPSPSPRPCAWRWPRASRAAWSTSAPRRGPARTCASATPPACYRWTPR